MVEIQDVNKFYGEGKSKYQALKNIHLCFRRTEFVAILGPSGSGKTTLLNVIGGLDHYDSGDLIIDDISTKNYSDKDWDSYRNHSIGFIFQNYNLIQHQTILSNVEMSLTISGFTGKEKKQRAIESLTAVGLGEHLNKRPNQLSGGQMQRVAIARALVNKPAVILADEPTGALDSKTSIQVMDILQETAKDRLVIMVTHNPDIAKQYATRIITLKDGEIINDTNPYHPSNHLHKIRSENMGRSSMSIFTALSLSFYNLWAKRKRTALTSFAGSIGIIGIALITALSTGVNAYIEHQEANMAYQYPLLVETLNMDISSVLSDLNGELSEKGNNQVEVIGFLEKLFTVLDTNDVGAVKTYIETPENDISHLGTVEYVYNVQPQIYVQYGDSIKRVCPDSTLDSLGLPVSNIDTSIISSSISTDMFYCMPENKSLYLDRYEVKAGHWPENSDECILVLTNEGKISDYLLYVLGLRDPDQVNQLIRDFVHGEKVKTECLDELHFDYNDFLGIPFKVVQSSDYYSYDAEYGGWRERTGDDTYMKNLVNSGQDLTIVGVIQPKPEFGSGVLCPGINYPFSLVTDTIERAKETEIVQNQLADPDIDIFTNTSFNLTDSHKKIDPMSLIQVDPDAIWNSVSLDQEKLQYYFKDGADFDSVQPALPSISIESYVNINELLDTVHTQIKNDLPALLADIQMSAEDMTSLTCEILEDSISFLDEKEYWNLEDVVTQLENHFASDEFRSMIRLWINNTDWENATEDIWQEQVGILTQLIVEDLCRYLEIPGLTDIPTLQGYFEEYLATERWQSLVRQKFEQKIQQMDMSDTLEDYIETVLQPLAASQISNSIHQLENDLITQGQSLMLNTQKELQTCMTNGLAEVLSHLPECVSMDMDLLTEAFSLRMDTQELSDLLLSFTNLSRASLSKNLSRLGYVEMSHPKSIQIYPHSFEDKNTIIEVLNKYNQGAEITDDQNHTISYTDTLGTVMGTVTHIITIITGSLIATVAVSLVVSSIMIGVITYISVLERRKEIGILRAMGASKHNISQIFNAETFITGFVSGVIGVTLGSLLLGPMNFMLHRYTGISELKVFLPVQYIVLLIIISVILTTIGGIIPAHNASKSDPVEALRTE